MGEGFSQPFVFVFQVSEVACILIVSGGLVCKVSFVTLVQEVVVDEALATEVFSHRLLLFICRREPEFVGVVSHNLYERSILV